SLHAKYYRAGPRILLGSANITDAALGWGAVPNLEILVEWQQDLALATFEGTLWQDVIPVNDQLYHSYAAAFAAFPTPPQTLSADTSPSFHDWRPQLRHPEDLWRAYAGDLNALSTAARESAAVDLTALDPPRGLKLEQFCLWVQSQIRQHPEFVA